MFFYKLETDKDIILLCMIFHMLNQCKYRTKFRVYWEFDRVFYWFTVLKRAFQSPAYVCNAPGLVGVFINPPKITTTWLSSDDLFAFWHKIFVAVQVTDSRTTPGWGATWWRSRHDVRWTGPATVQHNYAAWRRRREQPTRRLMRFARDFFPL